MTDVSDATTVEVPTPEPTGLAPLPGAGATLDNLPQLYLEFESTQAEPPLENIFLGSGGSICRVVSIFAGSRSTRRLQLSCCCRSCRLCGSVLAGGVLAAACLEPLSLRLLRFHVQWFSMK